MVRNLGKMIHLDSYVFYGIVGFSCLILAEILTKRSNESNPYFDQEPINLKPVQIAIPGHWNKVAQETIDLIKEMQKPRTITVINDQTKTRTAKRIRKGTNSRTKKKNSPARTRNKTVTKRNRLQSKQVKVSS
jgi:hypothetical protein